MTGATKAHTAHDAAWVEIGKIATPFGVKGWVKVLSYADPPPSLLNYSAWHLRRTPASGYQEYALTDAADNGGILVAKLAGVADRDAAAAIGNTAVFLRREQLPKLGRSQFYVHDIIGARVVNMQHCELGRLTRIIETGGTNEVMEVVSDTRTRLIPFVHKVFVKKVDVAAATVQVDWDEDY